MPQVCSLLFVFGFYRAMHYSAKHGLAIECRLSVCLSVCLSVTLVDHDHIGWKSYKLIARTIRPTSSLFVAHLLPGEHGEILGRKCSFNTYVHNVRLNWVNPESRDLVGGGVGVYLVLSAHRVVIFAIAQLSCLFMHFVFYILRKCCPVWLKGC